MSIEIRAYNVLFGDCLLVSWDENDSKHHAWIDFGNFSNDPNAVFTPVYSDILALTHGKLDLLVVSHKHMDHLEGFYSMRNQIANDFEIKSIWYAHVKPELDAQFKIVEKAIRDYQLIPKQVQIGEGFIGQLYQNNFGVKELTMDDRMNKFLEKFSDDIIHSVYRGLDSNAILPAGVNKLKIKILAPEYDSSVYFDPVEEALRIRKQLDDHFGDISETEEENIRPEVPYAQSEDRDKEKYPWNELADFARLRRKLQSGGIDLLQATDKTRNNTSVVLALTYEGKKILLAGDAEEKSWEVMKKKNDEDDLVADLIKVAHHGSINASPSWTFDKVFPEIKPSNKVIISTDRNRYPKEKYDNEVPKEEVLEGWKNHLADASSNFKRTDDIELGNSVVEKYD
jgi:beta-lactamase superfamily II metal-dependent hydrolase